ncbi:hypothetical protein ACS0TY_033024 [Phlomoides rotata]
MLMGKNGKVTKGRRSWTKAEEDALIQCLITIVNDGWKANNAFKEVSRGNLRKMSLMRLCGIHRGGAIGENAVDPIDIANEFMRNPEEQEGETGDKCDLNVTKSFGECENISVHKPSESGAKISSKGKKCKSVDHEMSSFMDAIGQYMKGFDETFNNLAQRMGTEYDAKVARTSLNDVMKLVPGLTLEDKLKVLNELVQNTQRLDYFLSLPHDEQAAYVYMILDEKL